MLPWRIPPGFSTFTRILRSCKAEVHVRANERRSNLLAARTVIVGKSLTPLPAAPFNMIDAYSRNNANAFCTMNSVPRTLTLNVASKLSGVTVPNGSMRLPTPALAKMTSMCPFSVSCSLICEAERRAPAIGALDHEADVVV